MTLYEETFPRSLNGRMQKNPVPLLISYADSASITVTIYEPVSGTLTAIQVNDLARNISYTWVKNATYPSGYWVNNVAGSGMTSAPAGQAPMVTPGNNLQMAVSAVNSGTIAGTLTFTIENTTTSAVLNSQAISVAAGGAAATSLVTLTMPSTALSLLISVTP